ncbi:hypothetical protein OSTOST_13257 [Ostertagia ostertagi]
MNEVYEGCDRFAKTLDSLLNDYRNLTAKLERLIVEKNLATDALRFTLLGARKLLDSLEKRNEIVKRSEIISEIKGVVADNTDLLSISWLRESLTTRLKAIENEELIAYIGRVEFHMSHFPSTIRCTASLSSLADYIIQLFLINATLLRPLSDSIRQRLHTDLESLLDAVESKLSPSVKYPDRSQLLSLWHRDGSFSDVPVDSSLPAWIYIHILIADSPSSLVSPHTSVEWTVDQYVKWCCEHTDLEIVSFLSGLLTSYTTTVISRHETQYVPHYPKMMELVRRATNSTT